MKIVINDTKVGFKDLEYIFKEMDNLGILYEVEMEDTKCQD